MMRRLAYLIAGCLAATAVNANGNPRQSYRKLEYPASLPVTAVDEMGAWLMRLADQFHVDGLGTALAVEPFGVNGKADCAPVGVGPGIHCIFNIRWVDQFEIVYDPELGPPGVYNIPGGVSNFNPSMMLIGLEPTRQGLRFLWVDNKGLPEGGTATIAGNRATLRAPCVNAPTLFLAMNPERTFEGRRPDTCERIIRIDARPGSTVVHMAFEIEINGLQAAESQLTLRRPGKADQR